MAKRPFRLRQPRKNRFGLTPERDDYPLERARALVRPRRARRGRRFRFRVEGLRSELAEGPLDLTIYGPAPGKRARRRYGSRLDPERFHVVVESTVRVRGGARRRNGRARFTFRSTRSDRPGRYVAVFRRTDFSSKPVARRTFHLTR
jgi:hypothetical protein